jgi:hypothetical protein
MEALTFKLSLGLSAFAFSIQSRLLKDISDLFDLGQFDATNQIIPLTMLPLSSIHSTLALTLGAIGNQISQAYHSL